MSENIKVEAAACIGWGRLAWDDLGDSLVLTPKFDGLMPRLT